MCSGRSLRSPEIVQDVEPKLVQSSTREALDIPFPIVLVNFLDRDGAGGAGHPDPHGSDRIPLVSSGSGEASSGDRIGAASEFADTFGHGSGDFRADNPVSGDIFPRHIKDLALDSDRVRGHGSEIVFRRSGHRGDHG